MNRYEKVMERGIQTGAVDPMLKTLGHMIGAMEATSPKDRAQHLRHARAWNSELALHLYDTIELPMGGFPRGIASNLDNIDSELVRVRRGGRRLV